jgi:hypothetical protein
MKNLILVVGVLTFTTLKSFAQCDKPITLSSLKTEFIDASGIVQDSKDEKTIVEISKTNVVITPGEDDQMNGTIKSYFCDWKVPFKEGKMIIKAVLENDRGETKNLTITIEGKDGKLTFLGEIEEMPDRKVRLTVDKFEEKK